MRVTIANELSRRGFSVDLVLAKAAGPNIKNVAPDIRVVDLNSPRAIYSLLPLMRYIKRERPHVVLSAMNYTNVIAAIACHLSGTSVKLVASEHANFGSLVDGRVRFKQRIVFALLRFAYRRVHTLIAVSKGVADDVSTHTGYPINSIRVIYNPVFSESLVARSKEPALHPWFNDPSIFVIVAAGRLTDVKGFDVLIDGFALAYRERRDIRLVILGDGELRYSLQNKIAKEVLEEKVCLMGFLENPYPYMARSSLFVLSSRMESFGNVLVEAMACGAQIVSTACRSGPMEILENGRWGKLVPVGSARAIAEAILASLDGNDKLAVKERAEYFSVDRAVNAYVEVILGTQSGTNK
ncbi:glycosyl transferase [Alcanivorax sp. N3-2A]|nr:glycosyl transferase [Alcanivorax sp. N3-2A]